MPPSNAIVAQGFKLEIQTGTGPIVLTEIKEITNFQGFDGEAAEIDVTHLQSTAKEFRMGLQDWGNFAVDTNYLPEDPGQNAARAAKGTGEVQLFTATFSDGSKAEFSGFVKNSPVSGAVDDKVSSSFSIRITGDVEFTEAP